MLDIGFSELVVIGVVALIVIGPERLPRVARTAGHLLGRFQRYVAEVKSDINRELELAELKKLQTSVEDAARSIEHSVKTGMEDAQKEFSDVKASLQEAGAELQKTEEALKQSVSAAQLPHMGTALQTSDDGQIRSPSEGPTSAEAPFQPSSRPSGAGFEASASLHSPISSHAHDEDSSPQMELALDQTARESAPRQD